MIYDKIKGNYEGVEYPLPTSSIFVYYGEKTQSGKKIPSINYVANVDGTRISGQFGKEWQTVYVDDSYGTNNAFTPAFDTVYIVNTTETDKIINLPTIKADGDQFAVKFVGDESHKVQIKSSSNIIKYSHSSSTTNTITLDYNTPQCYVQFYDGNWIVTYQGVNVYNNITPYWNTKLIRNSNTVNSTDVVHNTRYVYNVVTNGTITFQLPDVNTSSIQNNFRISIDPSHLGQNTSINIAPYNCSLLLPNGTTTTNYVLTNASKTIQIIKLAEDPTKWYVFEEDEEFWINTSITNESAVSAKNKHRYICSNANGVNITLPLEPNKDDRIAVFVQQLNTNKSVKIISPNGGKQIQVGNTFISPSDGTASNTNYLQIEAPLVYVEMIYYDSYWHVIKLITPSSQKDYKAGWGLDRVGTDTFVLTGSVDKVDNDTLTSTTVSQSGRTMNQFSVYDIHNRVSGGFGISVTPGTNGVTNISLSGNLPGGGGKYALVYDADNGTFNWVSISTCQ